jgi:predicted nucleotidyltransferase
MPLSHAELERLRPVLERIVARLGPAEIWLFGSRAENRARLNGDYERIVAAPDPAQVSADANVQAKLLDRARVGREVLAG